MRQTAAHRPYVGSAAVVSRHGQNRALSIRRDRAGFTLVEVVVATAILLISVLTLMVAYYGYYGRIQQLRISTIGDNLAQLQIEDVLSKSKAQLQQLCKGEDILDPNYTKPVDLPRANQQPPMVFDHDPDENVYDTGQSGDEVPGETLPVEGAFYIRHVSNIDGEPPAAASTDTPSGLDLPTDIVSVEAVPKEGEVGVYEYNVILHKNVFPGYRKRVRIVDTTPSMTSTPSTPWDNVPVAYHVFLIEVTVYWTFGGRTQSRVLRTEK